MKVSVIVPVYNMAADGKLAYCLDSILGQTHKELEIIAVDDASTDESFRILQEYADAHPGIVKALHNEENLKQGGAKNVGLKEATGEWISFIDSDDWIHPTFYEKLLAKAQESGADVVGCDYNLVHSHTMEVGEVIVNNDPAQAGVCTQEKKKLLAMRPGSMVIKIYRRDLIFDHLLNFPEKIFYEDNCAGTIWMLYCKQFEKVNEPLYYYYQHEVSTVHTITEERCRNRMSAGEQLVMESSMRGFLEPYHDEIEYRFTEIYYSTTLFSYLSGVSHVSVAFLDELRNGILTYFPEFRSNPYYLAGMGAEEKKLIGLHMKSSLILLWYYRLLHAARAVKKRIHAH
ncbi:MAG: glycosyltransferase [Lachnospiraceae bacterium]|nr:glycosyltransferase [Lachnospiraceae bacterium]